MRSVHDPELVELGLRSFRAIGYRGVGSIEFKRDDRDGRLKMIELDLRLSISPGRRQVALCRRRRRTTTQTTSAAKATTTP